MDIKLKAKLSAYSKVSSLSTNEELTHDKVTKEQIDSLFDGSDFIDSVSKDKIDTLFDDESESSEYEAVSHSQIDSLFDR